MIKLSKDRREFVEVSRFLYLIIKPRPRLCSKSGIPSSSYASLRSIRIFFLFKHLACYVPFIACLQVSETPPLWGEIWKKMFEGIATCNTCLFSRCSFTLRQRKRIVLLWIVRDLSESSSTVLWTCLKGRERSRALFFSPRN